MLSCSVVFIVASATVARACSVFLDIDPESEDSLDSALRNADTSNRVCAYGVSREGKNVSSCIDGVRGNGRKIEFTNGNNLSKSSPVYLEIQGHDELWLDTIKNYYHECNCSKTWGTPNKWGWCMSTNPNDDDKFKFSSSKVNKGTCFRTLKLHTNGVVYGMQSSYALSLPGVMAGFANAQASVSNFAAGWGRRLEDDGAASTWSELDALPEDAWVELPGQEMRRLENRLAALEERLQ